MGCFDMAAFDEITEPDEELEDALAASVRWWREEGAGEPLFSSADILAALFGAAEG